MELTDAERRALEMVKLRGPVTCAQLGDCLWPDAKGSSTCPMARSAGAVLARLQKKGLVRNKPDDFHRLFVLSGQGADVLGES